MKRKKIASKLLSLMLSAAVIVSSSFSGITLTDVSATEVPVEEIVVVSDNSVEEVSDVEAADEPAEDVSDVEVSDESVETPAEEPADEPVEEPETEAVEETPAEDVLFGGSEIQPPNPLKVVDDEEEEDVPAESAPVKTNLVKSGLKKTLTVVEQDDSSQSVGAEKVVAPEKVTTIPNDSDVVSSFIKNNSALISALRSIYNAQYSANLGTCSSDAKFTYAHLKEMNDVVDLNGKTSVTSAAGLGYLTNAKTIKLYGTGITEIPDNEFTGHASLETIVLPDTLVGIGSGAFASCLALKNVNTQSSSEVKTNTLPSKLDDEKTKSGIFQGCTSLTSITLPNFSEAAALQKATSIFQGCTGLETVTISANVSVIPATAFKNAGASTGMSVTVASGSKLTTIMDSAFQHCNMKELDLSTCSGLARFGKWCFTSEDDTSKSGSKSCSVPLEKLILPSSSSSSIGLEIEDEAFFKTQIKTICVGSYTDSKQGILNLPNYVSKLGVAAFYGNEAATSVVLSANIPRIEAYTFKNCSNITSITQSQINGDCLVTSIGTQAFYGTSKLGNANFLQNMVRLNYIGDEVYVISDTDKIIYIADYFTWKKGELSSSKLYGSAVFYDSGITSAILPESLRTLNSHAFGYANKLASVTWKTDAEVAQGSKYEIGTDAFMDCEALVSFVYPEKKGKGVSFVIGARAFWCNESLSSFSNGNTGLTNVFPATLTELKLAAFGGCTSLLNVTINNNESGKSPKMNTGVFAECNALATVVLPAAMTIVPRDMFYDCGLTSFPTFGTGTALTRIEDGAFFGNKMVTVDLSKYTKLNYIGPVAFAYWDMYHEDTKGTDIVVSDEAFEDTASVPLAKVILPNVIQGSVNMAWSDNIFQGAYNLTTVSTPSHSVAGEVYIPNYVIQKEVGHSVFSNTGVSKAYWGFTDASSAINLWTGIPDGMFAFTNVTNLADCCIPAEYLVSIGALSYAGTKMTSLDLTGYSILALAGDGAFANCSNLTTVKLPNNKVFTEVGDYMFINGVFDNTVGVTWLVDEFTPSAALRTIEYGGVRVIGDYAFASIDAEAKMNGDDYPDALAAVDLSATSVTEVGAHAYAGNDSLKTVKLDGVETLGKGAFRDCATLCLTSTPLADSLKTIGDYAFYRGNALGKVTFGAGVQEVGEGAFAEGGVVLVEGVMTEGTGVTALDFTKAKELVAIGQEAFYKNSLTYVDMSGAPVTKLERGVLSDCPYLTNIVLGDAVQKVEVDAVYGCISLLGFTFCSTTTIAQKAFYSNGSFEDASGKKITPIESVIYTIKTADLNVGIGNEMVFPLYINEASNKNLTGDFSEIIVGQAGSTDNTVHQYVKVMANTSKYYRNEAYDENIIDDSKYFEKTGATKYTVNDSTVYAFEILGLKPTPAGKTIPFSVTTKYSFTASGSVTATKDITANYKLKVADMSYYPVLYTESTRTKRLMDLNINTATGVTSGLSQIRVGKENTTGKMTLYYNVATVEKTNWRPENGNLIIKSSNPNVVTFSGKGLSEVDSSTWKMKAEQTSSTGNNMTAMTKGKTLVMTPVSKGTSVVTIYHEDCPAKKITWTINVNVDIKSVTVSIPSKFKKGAYEGDTFQIIEKITFYLGETVTRSKGTIETYKKYTDNRLYCSSSNPAYYSIDEYGNVTIKKSGKTAVAVLLAVLYGIPGGEMSTASSNYNIAYPEMEAGNEARTSKGESVKVVKKASGKKKAEVTYLAPKAGATNVTIPATVTVGGVKCKVVGIAEGAFANNKKVQKVKIAKGFTSIPKNMFKGCTKLKSVTLPTTITSIGDSAFQGCKALTKITIPKKVKSIGKKAFYNCSKLKKITVKSKVVKKVGKNAFKGIHKKAVIDVPNGKLSSYKTLFKKGQGKKVKIK